MRNIIVDLDGTIANESARSKLFLNLPCPGACAGGSHVDVITGREIQCSKCWGKGKIHHWTPYFEACDKDEPVEAVIRLMRVLRSIQGVRIYIMSGRDEAVKQKTEDWLKKHLVPYDMLIMRPIGYREDDHLMKLRWGKDLSPPSETWFVLEDRQRVVDAWRSAGYTCFQVAPGNF